MVAQGTATSSSLNLKFTHALAKVKFNTNILKSSVSMAYVDATLYNIYTTADCTVSPTDGLNFNFDNHIYAEYKYLTTGTTGEYYSFETLVIPQSADALVLYISSAGDQYIVKFDNTQTFEAGKIYEYDVVVGDSKAVLGNVTVSQWDDEVNAGNFVTE